MKAHSMPRESGHNDLFRVWSVPFQGHWGMTRDWLEKNCHGHWDQYPNEVVFYEFEDSALFALKFF